MSGENLSAVLHGPKDLRMEELPIPEPKDDEALLASASVGLCGSDVHFFERGAIGSYVLTGPLVLGHETSAVVLRVGRAVRGLQPGDRVAVEPGVPCRRCDRCKEGVYNVCSEVRFHACPPQHGTLTRYFTHAADFCYKLPAHVSLEEGALLEPLCVGVHACRRGGVTAGARVLVMGAGPVGLAVTAAARAFGASQVIVSDVLEHRLETARLMGATATVPAAGVAGAGMGVAAEAARALDRPPDVAFECSGSEAGVRAAILAVRPRGRVVLVGMGAGETRAPLLEATLKEVDIATVFRYANAYPLALELVSTGKVNMKPLITHHFQLQQTPEAFDVARTGKGNPIKIIINCSKDTSKNI